MKPPRTATLDQGRSRDRTPRLVYWSVNRADVSDEIGVLADEPRETVVIASGAALGGRLRGVADGVPVDSPGSASVTSRCSYVYDILGA